MAHASLAVPELREAVYPRLSLVISSKTRPQRDRSYDGTVTAASDWDTPAKRNRVRPGLTGSGEALFHELGER
jgi:hypothetical protein